MDMDYINPPAFGDPVGPFTRAIRVADILYISGCSAFSHLTGPIGERYLPADFEQQARLVFENLRAVVEAAGGTMADIFKTTVMLKDRAHFESFNAIRAEYFPKNPPIATDFVTELVREDMLIEVDAMARLG